MFTLLQAATAGKGGIEDMLPMILMLAVMFVIMYFFMIRPQRKKQKELQEFRNKLEVGSKVVTAGGIYGIVKSTNDGEAYITIEIATGVKIQVSRDYVFADPSQMQQR